MSEVDDLKDSVEQEIKGYKQFLDRARDINDLIPIVQERKQEAEVKYMMLTTLPADALDEYAPTLLPIQRNEQRRIENALPALPTVAKDAAYALTSGSTSAFYEATVTVIRLEPETPSWARPVLNTFGELAQEKSKKTSLPLTLAKIQPDLGEMFRTAVESFEKSSSGILGTDQAAIRMRDTIEQAWGGLVEYARRKCPSSIRNQRLELKKQTHRGVVAKCLAKNGDIQQLALLLENMANLQQELSPICKDPLVHNLEQLKRLYLAWILQLDDLVKSVDL